MIAKLTATLLAAQEELSGTYARRDAAIERRDAAVEAGDMIIAACWAAEALSAHARAGVFEALCGALATDLDRAREASGEDGPNGFVN